MDQIITGIIIAVAAVYTLKRFLKKLQPGSGGCGGCDGCTASKKNGCGSILEKDPSRPQ